MRHTYSRLRTASRLALVALLLAANPAAQAQDLYERALTEFNDEQYRESILTLRELLDQNPDNPVARVLMGRALLRDGEIIAALTTLQRARAEGADEDLVIVPLGRALLYQREFARLFDFVRLGDRRSVLEAEVSLVLAEARLLLNELDEADTLFFRATKLIPDDPAPVIGRALVQLRNGAFDAASVLAEKARELGPASTDVAFLDAEIRRAERRYEPALEAYERVLRFNEEHVGAKLGKASVLFNLGRYEEVRDLADAIREQLPDDLEALYYAGMSRARLSDEDGARELFLEAERTLAALPQENLSQYLPGLLLGGAVALALDDLPQAESRLGLYVLRNPRHVEAAKLLAATLMRTENPRGAIDALLPVIQIAPNDSGLKILLARARLAAGDPGEATRLFSEASELLNNDRSADSADQTNVAFDRAVARLRDGDAKGAISDLALAVGDSDSIPAGVLLASLHLQAGTPGLALETAEGLVKRHPGSAVAHNLRGAALRATGEPGEARKAFEQALRLDKNYIEPRINVARLEIATGDFDAAERSYKLALEAVPDSVDTMSDLARLLRDSGRREEAAEWLRKLIAIDGSRITDKVRLVQLVLEQESLAEASRLVEDLEGQHPENVQVLEASAYVAHLQDQRGEARATLRRAARLAGYDADWLVRLATNQLAIDDIDGARWSLDKAANSRPGFLPAERLLARIEIAEGKSAEALARAERLMETVPDQAVADIVRGDALFDQGDHAGAAEAYGRASRLQRSADLLMRRTESLLLSGDAAKALELLTQWLQRLPQSHEVRLALASTYSRAGEPDRAIEEYARLLAEIPDNPYIMNNLAWLYRETGRDGYMALIRQANEIAPENPAVLDTYGWILFLEGDDDRALRLLREAHTRQSKDPRIQYHLAEVLAARGRDEEALVLVTRALRIVDSTGQAASFDPYDQARALRDKLVASRIQ